MKRPIDRAYWLSVMYGCYHSCRMFTANILPFYQISLGFNPADLFFLHGFHSLALCALDLPISLYTDRRKRHVVILGGMGLLTFYYAVLWQARWLTGGAASALWGLMVVTELLHSIGRSAISGAVEGWITQVLAEEGRQNEYSTYSYRIQDYGAILSVITSIIAVVCAKNANLGLTYCFALAFFSMAACLTGFSLFAYYFPPTSLNIRRKAALPMQNLGSVLKNLVFSRIGQLALLASVCISLQRGVSYHFWQLALFHRQGQIDYRTLPYGESFRFLCCMLGPFAMQYLIGRFIKKRSYKGRNYFLSCGLTIFSGAFCGLLLAGTERFADLSPLIWIPLFCALQGAIAIGQTAQQTLYLEHADANWSTSTLSFMFLIGRIAAFVQSRSIVHLIRAHGWSVGRWIFVLPAAWGLVLGATYFFWVRRLRKQALLVY